VSATTGNSSEGSSVPPVNSVVIVGGGDCGARSARELRARGFRGDLTVVSAEDPMPCERPALTKAALDPTSGWQPASLLGKTDADELEIVLAVGDPATGIDRKARRVGLASGRNLPYDRLLLATGARPRALPVPGGDLAHTVRSLADVEKLRPLLIHGTPIVVIGAGLVGMEFAAAARRLGCEVTVVEPASSSMSRAIPAAIGREIVERHRREGVTLLFDSQVASIERVRSKFSVRIENRTDPLPADFVVSAVGAVPNVELASAAGLVVDDGVLVDDCLTTSDPTIFAAGDCARVPCALSDGAALRFESWRNACEHATVVARNMLGERVPVATVPYFWTDQYDLGIQVAGLPADAVDDVVRVRPDGGVLWFGLAASGRIVAAAGIDVGTRIGRDIKIAEHLIVLRIHPDPSALADPSISLKQLLATGKDRVS
jgi:3-phenylpropionate/trans-cinnamate dioxygenase ferredoxin reductase component